MYTNFRPGGVNITEVIDGTIRVIDNPDVSISELMKIIPGPDFPTSGIIYGTSGIKKAYNTGVFCDNAWGCIYACPVNAISVVEANENASVR